ncbi:MAG: NAD(P)/FAD-dependent oxidoreductase [Sphaerochaetaceae bacterium]|nr:NAD(P)/FAD-dependent oxidoreductase [Sphaerochaetaceae bacterium]
MKEHHRIIVVGAGMAGLSSATSLAMRGHKVLLLEKQATCGGLVNSFTREGFLFDGGIRAVENAGMVKPMLEELQIDLQLVPSNVSLGVEDKVIKADSSESLFAYEKLLKELYPESMEDVDKVIRVIARFDMYMRVLFGSDSPFFRDITRDWRYYLKTFPLWFVRFLATGAAIMRMRMPMEEFLGRLIRNDSLRDIISQHFFKKTPAFFAMSYFSLYPDYYYPKGGVGSIPQALVQRLTDLGSEVRTGTEVIHLDPQEKTLSDADGNQYTYDSLIWCADLKRMYRMIETMEYPEPVQSAIGSEKERILSGRGAESVFTLFLALDLPPEYFRNISEGHFFYTPSREGLKDLHLSKLDDILNTWDTLKREDLYSWLASFCELNTYEISVPVLNDSEAAPEGKSGLIVSFLFSYDLTRRIVEEGWYEQFEERISAMMIDTLTRSIYPQLEEHILFSFTASPLTIESNSGSSEGAIVGWSFEQDIPVDAGMLNMKKAVLTPIPDIYRAGQWTVSPAGLPTCIMTARMAADLVHKHLSKKQG